LNKANGSHYEIGMHRLGSWSEYRATCSLKSIVNKFNLLMSFAFRSRAIVALDSCSQCLPKASEAC
jgi:hypothetical protein